MPKHKMIAKVLMAGAYNRGLPWSKISPKKMVKMSGAKVKNNFP
jgi:hypothetical protein